MIDPNDPVIVALRQSIEDYKAGLQRATKAEIFIPGSAGEIIPLGTMLPDRAAGVAIEVVRAPIRLTRWQLFVRRVHRILVKGGPPAR